MWRLVGFVQLVVFALIGRRANACAVRLCPVKQQRVSQQPIFSAVGVIAAQGNDRRWGKAPH